MGQSLAKVSLVATMATLLQHFHFQLAEEVSMPGPSLLSPELVIAIGLPSPSSKSKVVRHSLVEVTLGLPWSLWLQHLSSTLAEEVSGLSFACAANLPASRQLFLAVF